MTNASVVRTALRQGSMMGLIGFVLAIASLILIFGLNYYETFVVPVVAAEAPAFVDAYGAGLGIGLVAIVFPATGGLFVVGYLMACIDVLHAQTFPRNTALVMMVGVVVFGAGLSGFLPMIVVQIGSVIFGLGHVLFGWALWKELGR